MRLGYWSPLPPAATGVADYSAALLPYLRAHGEVATNAAGDVNLYHVGNNGLHREIYERALLEPGIVVLHDALLQHFFLGSLSREQYVEEFVYNYGEWSRSEAEELWRERSRSGADARYFARPMLKCIATAARAVIVHNPAAAGAVRAHAPEARVFEIPHLCVPPALPENIELARFRHSLGVNGLLVGTFGHQRETKRLGVLLRAFHRALERGANVKLLVSGEFVSTIYAQAMEPLLQHPAILRTGHLDERKFWKHLAATDLCVNLRYPSAGESSGVAIRTMGIGRAVAFTNDASIERFPGGTCLRIDVGPAEEEMLAEYMVMLAKHRGAAQQIGENAARWIAQHHAPEKVAAAYWRVLSSM